MPEVYLTDSQLERVAQILYDTVDNSDDLMPDEGKELSVLADDMIRKIGDEGEEVDIKPLQWDDVAGHPVVVCPECKGKSESGSANYFSLEVNGICLTCKRKESNS